MNCKKIVTIFCILIINATPVYSKQSTTGIGTSLQSGRTSLYFPINSRQFIIEPTIRYSQSKRNPQDNTASYRTLRETFSVGIGLFKKTMLNDDAIMYYGTRLHYITSKDNRTLVGRTITKTTTSFIIAPTLGIEYYMSDNFSFGIELGLAYQPGKTTGQDENNSGTDDLDVTNTTLKTISTVLLRYHFD